MSILVWAILVVAFVIIEIATVQLVSIWLAAGALVTMICCYFFHPTVLGQLVIFLIISALFLAFTFPMLKKMRGKGHISTNAELDVGKSATVIEDIDQDAGTGRVTINGVDWSAVSASGEAIRKGSVVTVTRVQGAKLFVELKK